VLWFEGGGDAEGWKSSMLGAVGWCGGVVMRSEWNAREAERNLY
jgi:hypothetical protein